MSVHIYAHICLHKVTERNIYVQFCCVCICYLQVQLKNSDLGTTVDDVETLIKRHEAFEKLLNSQEDKVTWFPAC